MSKIVAAAPAQTTPPTGSESADVSDKDLAALLFPKSPAKAAGSKQPAAPAAEVEGDDDPELGDDEVPADTDPTAGEGEEPAAEEPAAEETTAEEPAAEEPAPAEEAAEESTDTETPEGLDEEDLATRKAFTPDQQKRFDRALFKQREKHRREVSTLQAELETARATPPAPAQPTADNPLADVADEATLSKRIDEQRQLRRWLLQHRDGGTIKVDGKDVEISAERAGELLADAEDLIQVHGPKRLEHLRLDRQLDLERERDYPWLKQKNTPGYVAVESMIRQYGNTRLRDIPGIRGSLADLFVGQVVRAQQKRSAAAAPTGGKPRSGNPPPKAPATPAGHRPPPKVAPAIAKTAGAQTNLESTGSDPGNAALRGLIGRRTR